MAYPISEIQGIGTDVAAVLKSDGIRTTVSLLRVAKTPKQRLKIALKTGAPEKSVLDWVTAADRMRVKGVGWEYAELLRAAGVRDRKSTRLNSSHTVISYAVFCLKKKKKKRSKVHQQRKKSATHQ